MYNKRKDAEGETFMSGKVVSNETGCILGEMMVARWRDFLVERYELGRKSRLPHVSIGKSFPRGYMLVSISSTEALGLEQDTGHHRLGASWTVSAERVTPQKRNYPSSLVPLSENRQNFVLSRIKRSRNI